MAVNNKKIILIINIILLIFILSAIIYLIFSYIQGNKVSCLDISSLINLKYDICYDSNLKSIIMLFARGADSTEIESIGISFTDNSLKKFTILPPEYNEIEKHNFSSSLNPSRLKLTFNLDEISNLCSQEEILFVRNCLDKNNLSVSFAFQAQGNATNQTIQQKSGIVSSGTAKKSKNIKYDCNPLWICGNWEECENTIQKRQCSDTNNCEIPINLPDFTKNCAFCQEDWKCEWSICQNGYTIPACIDLDNCNTDYSKPEQIACNIQNDCIPDIDCENWNSCTINLGLSELSNNIQNLQGIKSRLCKDSNQCIPPKYEYKNCSVKVDIYTKEIDWQEEKYLEVYDRLTNKLLSRLKYSENLDTISLNFYLD